MAELIVRSLQFNPDGSVAFDYMSSEDQRENGMLMSRALYVPIDEGEVGDELEDLLRTAERVLRRSLAEHESGQLVDDPDAPGPYDNPEDVG